MDPIRVRLPSSDDPTVIVDETVAQRHARADEATVILGPWLASTGVDPFAPTLVVGPKGGGTEEVAPQPSGDEATVVLDPSERAAVSSAAQRASQAPAPPATAATAAPGTTPGVRGAPGGVRYIVVGTAGKGGMGVVHVAQDVSLLRRVALKELSPAAAHDADARSRFVREVQVTAQLDHPHIVPVYGLEVAEGDRPAYAMKLVEGRTFVDMIVEARAQWDAGRRPDEHHLLPARLEHFLKVCDAVAYAHDRGVVHRDLKPANLMLGAHNEVYVMDWGLCRVMRSPAPVEGAPQPSGVAGDGTETVCGTVVGTPRYMSPEQARGENASLDARSDQYSLGAILFELVTLRPPIAGRNALDMLALAARGHREPLEHAYGLRLPADLMAIVEKAMQPAAGDRYPSVSALADDLRRYMRGDAVLARPDTPWQGVVRTLARHRQRVAIGMLAFVVLSLLTTVGLLWRHERALAQERLQQQRYESFVAEATKAGDALQLHLLDVRDDLNTLAATMAQAAQHAEPAPGTPRWAVAGAPLPAGGPHQGVFVRFPGASAADQDLLARRLVRAEPSKRELLTGLVTAFGDRSAAPQPAATSTGLVELRAGFDAGVLYVFPATAHALARHDPRTATWYRHALETRGTSWTVLADDGDEDVNDTHLAITAPVHAEDGRSLGAVGIVLALEDVLTNLVADCAVKSAASTALVDPGGRVLAACDVDGHVSAGDLDVFARPELKRALEVADSGSVDLPGEAPQVAAFDRIHPIGWSLVRAISREALLRP